MATSKLSGISSGGNLQATIDKIVAVRSGVSDVLVTLPSGTGTLSPLDYGAKFDGVRLFDCTVASLGNTATSASYTFSQADVGKVCSLHAPMSLYSGTPYPPVLAVGTIQSVSAGVATMSVHQTNGALSATGVFTFGTDDTAALQAAIDAACSAATTNKVQGNTVVLPTGIAMITAPLVMMTEVSIVGQGSNASCVKWVSTHGMGTGYEAAFVGLTGNGSTRYYGDVTFAAFEIDMDSAFVTAYSYHAKCMEIITCNRMTVRNMYCHGSPATGVGVDFLSAFIFEGNVVANCGRLKPDNSSTTGGGGVNWESHGGYFGVNSGTETVNIVNNFFFNIHNTAIENEGASLGNPCAAHATIVGNTIVTMQSFGNGIRDKGMTGPVIVGNTVIALGGTPQTTGVGIGAAYGGTQGLIDGNYIYGFYNGITLENYTSTGTSNNGYSVRGNTVKNCVNNGIQVLEDSPNSLASLNVTDNYVDGCGAAGLAFVNGGTPGTILNAMVSGNTFSNNGATTSTDAQKSGILVSDTVTGLKMSGNYCYDNASGKQKYGFTVSAGVTVSKAMVTDNHMNDNASQAFNILGTLAGQVANNYGDNTAGPTQAALAASYSINNIF